MKFWRYYFTNTWMLLLFTFIILLAIWIVIGLFMTDLHYQEKILSTVFAACINVLTLIATYIHYKKVFK